MKSGLLCIIKPKSNHITQCVPLPVPCKAHAELSQSVLMAQSQGRGLHWTVSWNLADSLLVGEESPVPWQQLLFWVEYPEVMNHRDLWLIPSTFPFFIRIILINYHVTLKSARLRHKCRIIGRYVRLDFIWCCLLIFVDAVILNVCEEGQRDERCLVRPVNHHQSSTSTWRTYLSLEMCLEPTSQLLPLC